MISRKYRFHGHHSLSYILKSGKSVRSEFVSLKYASSKRSDFRLSVVVSKKVSKSAVVRNRIRRRIYEIVRLEKASRPNDEWHYDLVIFVYDARLATVSHEQLHRSITGLLKKANITA